MPLLSTIPLKFCSVCYFKSLLWLFISLSCLVCSISAEHLPVKTYTVADGLLLDTVYKVKQDSRGFLWFCTAEGVSRFDGYGFTNFTTADGLPAGSVNDFLETRTGTIYLATDAGIARLNPSGVGNSRENPLFSTFSPTGNRPPSVKVLFDDGNFILVGTDSGLYKFFENSNFEPIQLSGKNTGTGEVSVTAIIKDSRGRFWVGTNGDGLYLIDESKNARRFTTADGLPGNSIASLLEDRAGKLWAGMRPPTEAGLVLLNADPKDGGSIAGRVFSNSDGIPTSWIPAMLNTSDGKFWLATTVGLCEWQGADEKSVCRSYRKQENLCDYDIWSIAEDRDGNVWTGSNCGAKKISRYGFSTYGEVDGIASEQVESIFEDARGELFVSFIETDSRTIYRFDGRRFTGIKPRSPADLDYVGWASGEKIRQDSSDAWLFSSEQGLFKFPERTKFEELARETPQKISPPTKGAEIYRFFEDSHGDYWLATSGAARELWQWEKNSNEWRERTEFLDSSKERFVTAFAEDKRGNIWIGTGSDEGAGELLRYRDGQFTVFSAADNVADGWYRDLYVDHAGRLWLANNKHGVFRLDDPAARHPVFIRYSIPEGLSGAGAYCITEDALGRIYIGGGRGIDRLTPETGQLENFTTADGLPSSFVQMAHRDRRNQLWFATVQGLAKFVPEPERARRAPTIFITGLRAGGAPQRVSILGQTDFEKLFLNSDQRQISIDFTGLGASLGEKLRYEYRLNDADWTLTLERTVNFANLSAGDYEFEVRAVSADRLNSPVTAKISFRIAAPFYFQSWFIVSAVLSAALATFGFYRYRLNRLLEIERTRTRIATDLHDDIGTNLSKISMLSEIVNLQLARQNNESSRLLNSIAEISRESVSSMSDIVWAINPQRDTVLDLVSRMRLHVEEVFLDKNVQINFNAPGNADSLKLPMNARREIFLVFKEAVSNAARHSGCRVIEIDFRLDNQWITLRVADDGNGFDKAVKREGNGLGNMKTRVVRSGGTFDIETENGRGTVINFRFPQN